MTKNNELTRKEQREEVIKRLFEIDINNSLEPFVHVNMYINNSVNGVLEHIMKVDQIIVNNLVNWKINRLSYVDRAIIRFAVYELYYTKTPYEIVINEALNLTRKFSDEGDSKMVGFTNKVLDNIKIFLKK